MALDLGTLYVNIKANTADTQRNIDNVKTSLQGIKNEAANTTDVLNKSFDDMGGDMQKAGGAISSMMGTVKSGMGTILGSVSSVIGSVSGIGGIAAAAIGTVSSSIDEQKVALNEYKGYLDTWANNVDDWATKSTITGFSVAKTMQYSMLEGLFDVDESAIESNAEHLMKTVGDVLKGENPNAASAFELLDIDLVNEDGISKSIETIWDEVIAGLRTIEDPIERSSLAVDIFGKTAFSLNPILEMEDSVYNQIISTYEEAFQYIDEHKLSDLQGYQDIKDYLQLYISALEMQKGAAIAPNETIKLKAEIETTKIKAEILETGTITESNVNDLIKTGKEAGEAAYTEDKTIGRQNAAEKMVDILENSVENEGYTWAGLKDLFTGNMNLRETGNFAAREFKYGLDTYGNVALWLINGIKGTITGEENNIKPFGNLGSAFSSWILGGDSGEKDAAKAYLRWYFLDDDGTGAFSGIRHKMEERNASEVAYLNETYNTWAYDKYQEKLRDLNIQSEAGMPVFEYVNQQKQLYDEYMDSIKVYINDTVNETDMEEMVKPITIAIGDAFTNLGVFTAAGAQAINNIFSVPTTPTNNQTINVSQTNNYSGNQNSFAAQFYSEKRLGKAVAGALRG